VAGLPRPDLAPGPHRELNDALHELHHRAGWPSLRALGERAGCSHTTVSHAFSSTRLPSWGLLEVLVEAMSGEPGRFRELWLAASAPTANGSRPATGTRPTSGPSPVRVEAPFIAGRRAELAVVRRHLEAGAGLLLVAGEAGIGKTRLVATAVAAAGARTFVASGSCLPLSTEVPLLPVTDALRSVLEHQDGQWMHEALAGCPPYVTASLARLLPELAEVATVTDPDDDWSRPRLFAAVGAALEALAARHPLAVVLDDLHWADTATLDLLEHLVVHGTSTPLVGTRRLDDPETSPANTAWWDRIRRSSAPHLLQLGALTREETRDQLALLLGEKVDAETADRIHDRSLGQPLFTEQLAIVARDGAGGLPGLLADILDHRLDELSEPAWAVTRALGLADRALPLPVLLDATGLGPDRITAALHDLRGRHLLAEDTGDTVGLRHPLLAEAVRRRLVPGESADQHRRLALALAALPEPSAAEVATHWRGADDRAHELVWRVTAARDSERRFAAAQAATHWLRALDLWPADHAPVGSPPVSQLEAYLAAMDALESSAQNDRASVVVARALSLAPGLTDEDLAGLYRRAADYMADIEEETALDLVERALHLLRRRPRSEGLLRALRLRAAILGDLGRVDEALATSAEAVSISEDLGDPILLRGSLMSLAWHLAVSGSTQEALRHAAAAARLPVGRPDPMSEVSLAMRHTDILLICGADVEDLELAARAGLAAVSDWHIDNVQAATMLANVSEARRRAGLVERACRLVDPWTEGPLQPHRWALYIERAKLDMLRGRSEDAMARFTALSSVELPALWSRAELARCIARNLLWLRDPQGALDCLLPVIEEAADADALASMGPLLILAASAGGDLVESLPAAEVPARRRELLARLQTARHRVTSDPLSAWRGGTLAASWAAELSRIDGSATVEVWLRAATGWDDVDRPHRAAYCRWRAAQVAQRSGQAGLAGRLLRRAARDAREHVPLLTWIRETGGV
jgi:tetratricopeptide (TPR) repeat protein